MKRGLLIAIDGPVASGKGTISKLLATKISGINLNSGGMYRALAYKCIQNGIPFTDGDGIYKILLSSDIDLQVQGTKPVVFLDGVDVSDKLSDPEVGSGASKVGFFPPVAREIMRLQRQLALQTAEQGSSVILEGRQIGVDVLPDADIKIFLTASLEVRAQRRLEQYQEKGLTRTLSEVIEETRERDTRDINREVGALPSNPEEKGYSILDNTNLSQEETLDAIMSEMKKRNVV